MESRFSGSSILPSNIIIAKWGEDRRIAISAHISSKKTFRSLSGATGEFLWQPEKWRFRVGLPRKEFSGPISSHRRMLISSGASSEQFFGPVACGQKVAIWLGTSSQPHVPRNESEREWIWGCLSPCRSPYGYEWLRIHQSAREHARICVSLTMTA